MKKKLKFLTALMLLLNVNVVLADEDRTEQCKNTILSAQSNFSNGSGVTVNFWYRDKFNGTGDWLQMVNEYTYYQLNGEGRQYIAFCRNPGASPGAGSFYCKKSLFNVSGDASSEAEKSNKAYEKGIIEILRNGAKEGSSGIEFAQTTLALRVFEKYWMLEADNGKYNNQRQNQLIKYYRDLWLDDSEIKGNVDEVSSKLGSSYVRTSKEFTTPKDNAEIQNWMAGGDVTSEMESGAKALVSQAFDASLDYLENGAASISWKKKGARSKSGDNVKYTHTFKIDKFTSSNASIKAEVECTDCAKYGISISVTGEDLLGQVSGGSGEAKLEINFSKPSDSYDCGPINYKIKLKYYDDTISTEAFVSQQSGCASCQEFFLVYADDVEKTQTIDATAELCTDESKCTAIVEGAECSENDSDVNFKEGYDAETCSSESDEGDLLTCIVNGVDPAGNSYKATTEEYKNVVNNQFCSVFCKEDYHFVLPGIKEVNSGRYFSLQASVDGKKLCLTSHIDKEDTFESQAETLRKAVIDAWNEWNKWYTGLNGSYEDGKVPNKYTDSCSYDKENCTYLDIDGDGVKDFNNPDARSCSTETVNCCNASADGWLRVWNYKTYNYSGGTGSGSQRVEDDDGYAQCDGCSESSCSSSNKTEKDGTQESVINQIRTYLEAATNSLNAAIKAYADLINEYNSCFGTNTYKADMSTLVASSTSGWKMGYEFNPKIRFWYEESYMNDAIKKYLDTVGTANVGGFTESFHDSKDGKTLTDASNNFKDIKEVLSGKTNFACYKTGDKFECGERPIQVGTVKYVKQKMTSDAEYITPTQFYTIYPSGGIVVGEAGLEDDIENADELTNLLPVGLGTSQGVYNYVLRVEDLGEYYDSKELGRLWGDDGSVLVTVLEEDGNCANGGSVGANINIDGETVDEGKGAYVCSYTVNCPDCPVECNPTCKNPVCPENNCPVECVNCVYTNNSPNVNYRPITPGDINPNDKDLGVNWKWDENGISTGLELKAFVTSTEIEEAGEKIYDIDYEDTTQSVDTDFAMKITLDANMVNKIKSYNDQFEGNDGYSNNSLKCYDHINSNDGKTYKNIYCYSTFIDELLYDGRTKEKVDIVGNRIIGTDESSSDTLRKTQTQQSGYWTTWSEATPQWNITTSNGMSYYKQNYQNIGIGPSWK